MNHTLVRRVTLALLAVALAALPACRRPVQPAEPDYARQLPPGAFGLRKITDPAKLPDLAAAAASFDSPAFKAALQKSLQWFKAESTKAFFPIGPITHDHAHASVFAMGQINERSPASLAARILTEFDVWESVGWDGSGEVLYTGYYTPVFNASRTRTGPYQYPIYSRPADLVTDPATGKVIGQRGASGTLNTYPTRSQLVDSGALNGLELVYLPDALDAYIIEVNGSARLNMADGTTMYVGFAGTNGHEYTSIGKLLGQEGKIDPNRLSLTTLRSYFKQHPGELSSYVRRNDRFVFFREYDGSNWPAGSLGFQVTPNASLATDKAVFPRGCVTLVSTSGFNDAGQPAPLHQFMLDQDTGGAIRAAGRGDIYYGIGPRAEWFAGRQRHEGRLYYFLLKPERLPVWLDRMQAARSQPISTPF